MNRITIIMYHYVRQIQNGRYSNIKGLEISDFEEQIKFLVKNFNIIKMEDLIEFNIKKTNDGVLPENACLLTFDDGYIDHYTNVFPILTKYNLQGSFFIPARILDEKYILDVNKIHYILVCGEIVDIKNDVLKALNQLFESDKINRTANSLYNEFAVANRFDNKDTIFVKRILQNAIDENLRSDIVNKLFKKYVDVNNDILFDELYMTKEQLQIMKNNGMHIGVHGYNHYWLGKVDYDTAESDIKKAITTLDGLIDIENWTLNYPYGSHNDDTIKIAKENGCLLSFSTEVQVADLDKDNIFALPRLDTNDFPPKSENYKMILV